VAGALAFAVGLIAAMLVTMEARAGATIGYPIWGAVEAFWGAEVLLTVAVVTEGIRRSLPLLSWKERPRWFHVLPGICGATFQIAAVYVPPLLGAGAFWLCAVMGQLLAAVFLDHWGMSGTGVRHRITVHRAVALLVAAGGSVLTVADRLTPGASSDDNGGVQAVAALLSVAAGTLQPVQAALNRDAAKRLHSALQTTWWSFFEGCIAVALIWGIQLGSSVTAAAGLGPVYDSAPMWVYLAGIPGLALIFGALVLTGVIGSSAFFVLLICGQLIGSAVIDATGWLGSAVRPANQTRIVGILVVIVAAAALQFDPPRHCVEAVARCIPRCRGRHSPSVLPSVLPSHHPGSPTDSIARLTPSAEWPTKSQTDDTTSAELAVLPAAEVRQGSPVSE
jgi:transporter family-2 protein